MSATLGLYVHWPWCRSRCPYCDFNAHVSRTPVDSRRWLAAYVAEMRHLRTRTGPRMVQSVFFGGGTPSLMAPDLAAGVLEAVRTTWDVADDAEITFEANPGSVETGRFQGFRDAGFNRVSVGVQSLEDRALRFLGRGHSAEDALDALEVAARWFPRFSFDLIYGRPEQTVKDWIRELREALRFAGDHVSCYQLTIEEGTPFHALHEAGSFRLPDEDVLLGLLLETNAVLTDHGLCRYEISNHARPGGECRHNLTCWRYRDYAGVGPGAHGRIRYGGVLHEVQQVRDPSAWLRAVETRDHGTERSRPLEPGEAAREMLLMGLRLAEGIHPSDVRNRTGVRFEDVVGTATLDRAVGAGLLETDDDTVRVTPEGLPVLDGLLRELLA